MPPKRKPSSSTSPSILITSPKTPTTAELAKRMLAKRTVDSPLLTKSNQIDVQIPTAEEEEEEDLLQKIEVSHSTPDAADEGSTGGTSAKQGTATLKPNEKEKATARKRKATTTDEAAKLAAKQQEAAPKKRATPKKTTAAPKRRLLRNIKDEDDPEIEPPLPPLPLAIIRKIKATNSFLDTHPKRLLQREAGSHIASISELDLLAALLILRVEYQLGYTVADVSLEDAEEMIIDTTETGRVSVDFNKTCNIERAAQAKFAERQTGLETVNLLEVEIDMLVAKRNQLVEDEMPAARFRVYDDEAADGDEHVSGDAAEEDDVLGESQIEEDQVGKTRLEKTSRKRLLPGRTLSKKATSKMITLRKKIVHAVASEDESDHEKEPEVIDEQGLDSEPEGL